jgi:hypothetical protein
MIAAAIDPGKNGYLCMIDADQIYTHSLDFFPDGSLNSRELISHISNLANLLEKKIKVVVEDVHAIFGVAAKATFNFGYVCGQIESSLQMASIPYIKVQPKTWQKEIWQGIPEIRKPSIFGSKSHKLAPTAVVV